MKEGKNRQPAGTEDVINKEQRSMAKNFMA